MNRTVDGALAKEFGLSAEEYARVLAIMGRTPSLTELGIFSVMWSEHCSYKSSRVWLKTLPTKAPWVIHGPGENAGVVDIGEGLAAIFKMESHNHPSFIEPYQGAATGVGGILRDVFTMGARPIANLNALRFGSPDHPATKRVVDGVVRGVGGYGNCVGVPTVGGEVNFHPAYNGNPLVNAMTVGIAPRDRIFLSAAAGVGNPVVYVGSRTGRDGIHGATMASAEFGADSESKRPTVQVGDPFTEKLLIEACLELMATDAIVAIQDMGAAGLTSSAVEMAGKGGVGIHLDLDRVPQRENGMTAYEMMLSESQERMLIVLRPGPAGDGPGDLREMGTGFCRDRSPDRHRPHRPHPQGPVGSGYTARPFGGAGTLVPPAGAGHATAAALGRRDQPGRCARCLGDAGGLPRSVFPAPGCGTSMTAPSAGKPPSAPARPTRRSCGSRIIRLALALTTDCTPRYCLADPRMGGMQAVAEAWRNITATGATPLAVTDNMNFGNPEKPIVMGQFAAAIGGMGRCVHRIGLPRGERQCQLIQRDGWRPHPAHPGHRRTGGDRRCGNRDRLGAAARNGTGFGRPHGRLARPVPVVARGRLGRRVGKRGRRRRWTWRPSGGMATSSGRASPPGRWPPAMMRPMGACWWPWRRWRSPAVSGCI